MRIHYMSDLHLEAQAAPECLPRGDLLILAGDICHAACLDPQRTDRYNLEQRERVLRFFEAAARTSARIIWIAGNHEHHDGEFEATHHLMRGVPGPIDVLDGDVVEIGELRVFGATLWTDMGGGDPQVMEAVARRMGDFFFIRTRDDDGCLRKFRPSDAHAQHLKHRAALSVASAAPSAKPLLIVTHHAPSRLGCAPAHQRQGYDARLHCYASDLDTLVAQLGAEAWIHGHTHVAAKYRIGNVTVLSNARGFLHKGQRSNGFTPDAHVPLRAALRDGQPSAPTASPLSDRATSRLSCSDTTAA